MAEDKLTRERTSLNEGEIIPPRKLTWGQGVAIVSALLAGTIFAIEIRGETAANAEEIAGHKIAIRELESARSRDSERLVRVEEQTKALLDLMSRALNKLDRIEDAR